MKPSTDHHNFETLRISDFRVLQKQWDIMSHFNSDKPIISILTLSCCIMKKCTKSCTFPHHFGWFNENFVVSDSPMALAATFITWYKLPHPLRTRLWVTEQRMTKNNICRPAEKRHWHYMYRYLMNLSASKDGSFN